MHVPQGFSILVLLPMKKGTVCCETNQGEQEVKTNKRGSKTGMEFSGLSRRKIRITFFSVVNHRPPFLWQFCVKFRAIFYILKIPWSHKPVSLNGRLGNSEIGGCKEIR